MPSRRIQILIFVFIAIAGLVEGALECRRQFVYRNARQKSGAVHNAIAFPPAELAALAGSPADTATAAYQAIHDNVSAARLTHPAIGYVGLFRHYPATGHTVSLVAAGPPSENAHIPRAGDSLDGTPDADAAIELTTGGRQSVTAPLHRNWERKYWSAGYARCDGGKGPLPPGATHVDIFRYDIDASAYWFPPMMESGLVHLFSVWLLAGLPIAAYLLGKRHRIRELQIHQIGQAIEHTATPIFIVRAASGFFKYANPSFCKLCDRSLSELLDLHWRSVRVDPPDPDMVAQRGAMLMEGITLAVEWNVLRKDNTSFPMKCTLTPVRGENGAIEEIIGTLTDISELRRQALILQHEKEKAEQTEHTQTLLIAAATNEVMEPLAELDRLSGRLLEENLPPEQAGYAANIRKSCLSLRQLTLDLGDLSNIGNTAASLTPVHIAPREFIAETLDIVRPQAAGRRITLRCEIAPDVPRHIVIAADRLRQILLNLVGNALKFTTSGEIVIRLKNLSFETVTGVPPSVIELIAANKQQGLVSLLFSVRDTGIGISPENQKNLFSPFWQADAGNTRHYEGAGLGLPISRQLARLLGGDICVESEPGRGSTFYFSVTCTIPPSNTRPPHA